MTTNQKPAGAFTYLVIFFLHLAFFWAACFYFHRDAIFYALSLVGASVFTLAVQGRSIGGMPRWLSIALWIPTWLFLLVIAGMAVQLGVHRLFGV